MTKWIETIKQLSGVVTATAIILGVAGYITKPHAEMFIREAVNDRVTAIEQGQNALDVKLRHVERALKENTDSGLKIQTEQRILVEQQQLIIKLLKSKMETTP